MLKRVVVASLLLTVGSLAVAARAADPVMQSQEHMVAQAPNEHLAEAARYEVEAKDLDVQAAKHRSMANTYAAFKGGSKSVSAFGGMVRHCRRLAASYEQTARDARALAQAHRDMAK